jgi:hypothetical protein
VANPSKVNFGGKKFGETAVIPLEIQSCGEGPLEIYSIYLTQDSSPDFDLDLWSLDFNPTPETPLVIPAGDTLIINVLFVPDSPNPVDEDGELLLDTVTIVFENNSAIPAYNVPVAGAGIEPCCGATAIIKCEEGDQVIPQTVLHLIGDESYVDNGSNVAKWEWEVDQPSGSQSSFVPSSTFPNPTFEVNVSGVYTFYLTAYNQLGTPSCFPAEHDVVVIPEDAIHIELLWFTPEDPDETDTGPSSGADLDLHFLHPSAAGPDLDGNGLPDGWFDVPLDCFWYNAHPEWGSMDPAVDDNPALDRDDTDGAGPENLNLYLPEEAVYRVGVHYWNDHDYGPSYATVRVYIYSQLVFEASDVMLTDEDLWEVCTISWPSGKVALFDTGGDGTYKITPNYPADPALWGF